MWNLVGIVLVSSMDVSSRGAVAVGIHDIAIHSRSTILIILLIHGFAACVMIISQSFLLKYLVSMLDEKSRHPYITSASPPRAYVGITFQLASTCARQRMMIFSSLFFY
jgi:hypothetical protein